MKLLISSHKPDDKSECILSFSGNLDNAENPGSASSMTDSGKNSCHVDLIMMNFSDMPLLDHLTDPDLIIHVRIIDHSSGSFTISKESAEAVGKLSIREMEILEDIVHDYSYAQIAEKRFIEVETVKTHFTHIYQKLGISQKQHPNCKAMARNAYYRHICK